MEQELRGNEAMLPKSFFDLIRISDIKESEKRHQAIREWWDVHIACCQAIERLDKWTLAMAIDRFGVAAHCLRMNERRLAELCAKEHGVVQTMGFPMPDKYDPIFDRPLVDPVGYVDYITRMWVLKHP